MYYFYAEKKDSGFFGSWHVRLFAIDTIRRYVYASSSLPSGALPQNVGQLGRGGGGWDTLGRPEGDGISLASPSASMRTGNPNAVRTSTSAMTTTTTREAPDGTPVGSSLATSNVASDSSRDHARVTPLEPFLCDPLSFVNASGIAPTVGSVSPQLLSPSSSQQRISTEFSVSPQMSSAAVHSPRLSAQEVVTASPVRSRGQELSFGEGESTSVSSPGFRGDRGMSSTPSGSPGWEQTGNSFSAFSGQGFFDVPKSILQNVRWKTKIKLESINPLAKKSPVEGTTGLEKEVLRVEIKGAPREMAAKEAPAYGPLLCEFTGLTGGKERCSSELRSYIHDRFFQLEIYDALKEQFEELDRGRNEALAVEDRFPRAGDGGGGRRGSPGMYNPMRSSGDAGRTSLGSRQRLHEEMGRTVNSPRRQGGGTSFSDYPSGSPGGGVGSPSMGGSATPTSRARASPSTSASSPHAIGPDGFRDYRRYQIGGGVRNATSPGARQGPGGGGAWRSPGGGAGDTGSGSGISPMANAAAGAGGQKDGGNVTSVILTIRFLSEYEYIRFLYCSTSVLGQDKLTVKPYCGFPPFDPRNDLALNPLPPEAWHFFRTMENDMMYLFMHGSVVGTSGPTPSVPSTGSLSTTRIGDGASTGATENGGDGEPSAEEGTRREQASVKPRLPLTALHDVYLCVTYDYILILQKSGSIPLWVKWPIVDEFVFSGGGSPLPCRMGGGEGGPFAAEESFSQGWGSMSVGAGEAGSFSFRGSSFANSGMPHYGGAPFIRSSFQPLSGSLSISASPPPHNLAGGREGNSSPRQRWGSAGQHHDLSPGAPNRSISVASTSPPPHAAGAETSFSFLPPGGTTMENSAAGGGGRKNGGSVSTTSGVPGGGASRPMSNDAYVLGKGNKSVPFVAFFTSESEQPDIIFVPTDVGGKLSSFHAGEEVCRIHHVTHDLCFKSVKARRVIHIQESTIPNPISFIRALNQKRQQPNPSASVSRASASSSTVLRPRDDNGCPRREKLDLDVTTLRERFRRQPQLFSAAWRESEEERSTMQLHTQEAVQNFIEMRRTRHERGGMGPLQQQQQVLASVTTGGSPAADSAIAIPIYPENNPDIFPVKIHPQMYNELAELLARQRAVRKGIKGISSLEVLQLIENGLGGGRPQRRSRSRHRRRGGGSKAKTRPSTSALPGSPAVSGRVHSQETSIAGGSQSLSAQEDAERRRPFTAGTTRGVDTSFLLSSPRSARSGRGDWVLGARAVTDPQAREQGSEQGNVLPDASPTSQRRGPPPSPRSHLSASSFPGAPTTSTGSPRRRPSLDHPPSLQYAAACGQEPAPSADLVAAVPDGSPRSARPLGSVEAQPLRSGPSSPRSREERKPSPAISASSTGSHLSYLGETKRGAGVGVAAFFPLSGGLLTESPREGAAVTRSQSRREDDNEEVGKAGGKKTDGVAVITLGMDPSAGGSLEGRSLSLSTQSLSSRSIGEALGETLRGDIGRGAGSTLPPGATAPHMVPFLLSFQDGLGVDGGKDDEQEGRRRGGKGRGVSGRKKACVSPAIQRASVVDADDGGEEEELETGKKKKSKRKGKKLAGLPTTSLYASALEVFADGLPPVSEGNRTLAPEDICKPPPSSPPVFSLLPSRSPTGAKGIVSPVVLAPGEPPPRKRKETREEGNGGVSSEGSAAERVEDSIPALSTSPCASASSKNKRRKEPSAAFARRNARNEVRFLESEFLEDNDMKEGDQMGGKKTAPASPLPGIPGRGLEGVGSPSLRPPRCPRPPSLTSLRSSMEEDEEEEEGDESKRRTPGRRSRGLRRTTREGEMDDEVDDSNYKTTVLSSVMAIQRTKEGRVQPVTGLSASDVLVASREKKGEAGGMLTNMSDSCTSVKLSMPRASLTTSSSSLGLDFGAGVPLATAPPPKSLPSREWKRKEPGASTPEVPLTRFARLCSMEVVTANSGLPTAGQGRPTTHGSGGGASSSAISPRRRQDDGNSSPSHLSASSSSFPAPERIPTTPSLRGAGARQESPVRSPCLSRHVSESGESRGSFQRTFSQGALPPIGFYAVEGAEGRRIGSPSRSESGSYSSSSDDSDSSTASSITNSSEDFNLMGEEEDEEEKKAREEEKRFRKSLPKARKVYGKPCVYTPIPSSIAPGLASAGRSSQGSSLQQGEGGQANAFALPASPISAMENSLGSRVQSGGGLRNTTAHRPGLGSSSSASNGSHEPPSSFSNEAFSPFQPLSPSRRARKVETPEPYLDHHIILPSTSSSRSTSLGAKSQNNLISALPTPVGSAGGGGGDAKKKSDRPISTRKTVVSLLPQKTVATPTRGVSSPTNLNARPAKSTSPRLSLTPTVEPGTTSTVTSRLSSMSLGESASLLSEQKNSTTSERRQSTVTNESVSTESTKTVRKKKQKETKKPGEGHKDRPFSSGAVPQSSLRSSLGIESNTSVEMFSVSVHSALGVAMQQREQEEGGEGGNEAPQGMPASVGSPITSASSPLTSSKKTKKKSVSSSTITETEANAKKKNPVPKPQDTNEEGSPKKEVKSKENGKEKEKGKKKNSLAQQNSTSTSVLLMSTCNTSSNSIVTNMASPVVPKGSNKKSNRVSKQPQASTDSTAGHLSTTSLNRSSRWQKGVHTTPSAVSPTPTDPVSSRGKGLKKPVRRKSSLVSMNPSSVRSEEGGRGDGMEQSQQEVSRSLSSHQPSRPASASAVVGRSVRRVSKGEVNKSGEGGLEVINLSSFSIDDTPLADSSLPKGMEEKTERAPKKTTLSSIIKEKEGEEQAQEESEKNGESNKGGNGSLSLFFSSSPLASVRNAPEKRPSKSLTPSFLSRGAPSGVPHAVSPHPKALLLFPDVKSSSSSPPRSVQKEGGQTSQELLISSPVQEFVFSFNHPIHSSRAGSAQQEHAPSSHLAATSIRSYSDSEEDQSLPVLVLEGGKLTATTPVPCTRSPRSSTPTPATPGMLGGAGTSIGSIGNISCANVQDAGSFPPMQRISSMQSNRISDINFDRRPLADVDVCIPSITAPEQVLLREKVDFSGSRPASSNLLGSATQRLMANNKKDDVTGELMVNTSSIKKRTNDREGA